jgi:hypothetical protein
MANILSFVSFGKREPVGLFEPYRERAAPTRKKSACRDWSNQELADLYRVEALLTQANIRIKTTRGTSDEGDPWFVFCHADGEVFVHLARIDGLYILDGPGLGSVLSGPSFATLIDRFANAVAARAPAGNVVQFPMGRSDSVVRLHPAVMLAALVWSLYLASDHFVGTAHAGELDAGDASHALFPSLATSLDHSASTVHELAGKALVQLDGDASGKAPSGDLPRLIAREADLSRTGTTADGGGTYWNMIGSGSATGIAAGLTAIAVSFGLYDQGGAEHPHGIEMASIEPPLPQMAADHGVAIPQSLMDAAKAVAESGDAPAAREATVNLAAIDIPPLVTEHVQIPINSSAEVAKVDQTASSGTETVGRGTLPHSIDAILLSGQGEQVEQPLSQGTTVAKTASTDDTLHGQDLQSLVALAAQHLGQISAYEFDGLSVDATFDVSTLSKQTAQLVLSDLSGPPQSTDTPPPDDSSSDLNVSSVPPSEVIAQHLPYDDAAKSFVYQFLLKSQSIEMITSDSSVVFIDTSAVDDPGDQAYSVSWVSDDHFVVSTVGHAQDFAGVVLA